ncbi:hypothetical protein [Cellulomonas flavigena]|nr:hypothetical protein [Cellulomonas flavigena]
MSRRPGRAPQRVVVAGVMAASLCLVAAGCVEQEAPSVPVGELWEGDDGESVRLDAGGVGVVEAIPYGAGDACDPEDFRTMSGDIEWEVVDDGEVVLRQGDAEVDLRADRGGFGPDIIWRDVFVGPCGDASGDHAIELTMNEYG